MSVFHAETCSICRGRVELGPVDIRSVGDDKAVCRICAAKLPATRITIRKRGLTNTNFPIIEKLDIYKQLRKEWTYGQAS
jgi:hypothetical protein